MSYTEYWENAPELLVSYAHYYDKKSKADFAEQDTLAWMIGSYVSTAIASNLNSAFGKKGSKTITYPTQPVFVCEIDDTAKAKKQERQMAKFEANFLAAAHNMGVEINIEDAAS